MTTPNQNSQKSRKHDFIDRFNKELFAFVGNYFNGERLGSNGRSRGELLGLISIEITQSPVREEFAVHFEYPSGRDHRRPRIRLFCNCHLPTRCGSGADQVGRMLEHQARVFLDDVAYYCLESSMRPDEAARHSRYIRDEEMLRDIYPPPVDPNMFKVTIEPPTPTAKSVVDEVLGSKQITLDDLLRKEKPDGTPPAV